MNFRRRWVTQPIGRGDLAPTRRGVQRERKLTKGHRQLSAQSGQSRVKKRKWKGRNQTVLRRGWVPQPDLGEVTSPLRGDEGRAAGKKVNERTQAIIGAIRTIKSEKEKMGREETRLFCVGVGFPNPLGRGDLDHTRRGVQRERKLTKGRRQLLSQSGYSGLKQRKWEGKKPDCSA